MRMNGKSTRLIDQAVQKLFEYGEIFIPTNSELREALRGRESAPNNTFVDPDYEAGNRAQEDFLRRLLRRLHIEHPDQFIVKGSKIKLKNEHRPD